MKQFFLMLGFFTRLPVPKTEFTEEGYRKAMKLMPLVGLVIGAVLALVSLLLYVLQAAAPVHAAVLTCAYIILTGGLHFDGLADTCDGVFSGRTREQSLEIMKDSRIGVFGLLGILMAGLLYFALFTDMPLTALLVFPLCGRACCLISASLAPYAREDGMGKATAANSGSEVMAVAILSLVGASFLMIPFALIPFIAYFLGHAGRFALLSAGFPKQAIMLAPACSLIAAGAAILVTVLMTARIRKKLGGVTGDTFGAVIEVSGIVYLLVFTILYQVLPV